MPPSCVLSKKQLQLRKRQRRLGKLERNDDDFIHCCRVLVSWYTRLLCVCALFDGIKSSLCCNSNGIFLCMNIKLFTSQAARLSRKKAWKGQKRFRIDCIKSPGFVCSLFRSIWYRIKNVLPSCLCMSLVSKELSYLKGESGDERERTQVRSVRIVVDHFKVSLASSSLLFSPYHIKILIFTSLAHAQNDYPAACIFYLLCL